MLDGNESGQNIGPYINNKIFSLKMLPLAQVLLLVYRHTLHRYRYGTEVRALVLVGSAKKRRRRRRSRSGRKEREKSF